MHMDNDAVTLPDEKQDQAPDLTASYEEELAALRTENDRLKAQLDNAAAFVSTGTKTSKLAESPDCTLRRAFGIKGKGGTFINRI